MRIPVRCTACGFSHRANLRDLPDGVLICPICEHEAKLPADRELAEFEHLEARQRTLTVMGAGAFFLGLALLAGYAGFSEAHPGEALFGPPLLFGALGLGLFGLIATVLQESKTAQNTF